MLFWSIAFIICRLLSVENLKAKNERSSSIYQPIAYEEDNADGTYFHEKGQQMEGQKVLLTTRAQENIIFVWKPKQICLTNLHIFAKTDCVPFVHQLVCLSVCLSFRLSVCLFVFMFFSFFLRIFFFPSVNMLFCLGLSAKNKLSESQASTAATYLDPCWQYQYIVSDFNAK